MPRNSVLLSSAGRRVALIDIFRGALAKLGLSGRVLACDMSPLAPAVHYADEGLVVPPCSEEDFIARVLEICDAHEVGLVVPTIDPELPFYARARGEFQARGVTIAVSSPDTVAIAADKVETHRWLLAHGFPTVSQCTAIPGMQLPPAMSYPLIAKPRWGSGTKGVVMVTDDLSLSVALRQGEMILQEVAIGNEYTVDVFMDVNGRCRAAVPRRRLEVRAGEVSKGMTVQNRVVEGLAAEVAETLPGAFGVLNIQMFHHSVTGRARVIEINPRFGGGFPLSWRAGADFAVGLLQSHHQLPVSEDYLRWKPGILMLRYDDAVFTEASCVGITP